MTCMKNYSGDGITKAFPVPFAIPADYALEVLVNGAAPEQGFHILGAGSADGPVVVFDGAPAVGEAISLRYLGGVTIGIEDGAAGHLANKLVAGAGVTLAVETGTTGIQQIRVAATEPADMLKKSENLADLPDKETARTNLGVYSVGQTNTAISTAVSTLSADVLHANLNLGDVKNVAASRANLDVYSKAEVDNRDQAVHDAALLKANNLSEFSTEVAKAAARGNLGLDQVAYLNVAQNWSKPQRSQAVQLPSAAGSVVLDFSQNQNVDLTLAANVTFANPTLTSAQLGQKGTIGIIPAGFAIAGMGTYWKRVGDIGAPSVITGVGRIDYHIRALDRIEYAYNDVEA